MVQPYLHAALMGTPGSIRILLKSGTDISALDYSWRTPLQWADAKVKDDKGITSQDIAKENDELKGMGAYTDL